MRHAILLPIIAVLLALAATPALAQRFPLEPSGRAPGPVTARPSPQVRHGTEYLVTSRGTVPLRYTEINGRTFVQGDMKVDLERLRSVAAGTFVQDEAGVEPVLPPGIGTTEGALSVKNDPDFFWPDARVPFGLAPRFANPTNPQDQALATAIGLAIDRWERETPLRFVPRTTEKDWVEFIPVPPEEYCWAEVGRQGGHQEIGLSPGCGVGPTAHEIGHAVGLFHEQSRPDRDQHVQVQWHNTKPGMSHNFDIEEAPEFVWFGEPSPDAGPYDIHSFMHYGSCSFAKDKAACTSGAPGWEAAATLVRASCPPGAGCSVGTRQDFTDNDRHYLRKLYCPVVTTDPGRCSFEEANPLFPGTRRSRIDYGNTERWFFTVGDYSDVLVEILVDDLDPANDIHAWFSAGQRPDRRVSIPAARSTRVVAGQFRGVITFQATMVPPGEQRLELTGSRVDSVNDLSIRLVVLPSVIQPDAFEGPGGNDGLSSAAFVPDVVPDNPMLGGGVSHLNFDQAGDADFFTVQLPPGVDPYGNPECIDAVLPPDKRGSFSVSVSPELRSRPIRITAWRDGQPFSVVDGTRMQLSCPHGPFPDGRVTFSVQDLNGRNFYELTFHYHRDLIELQPGLVPDLQVQLPKPVPLPGPGPVLRPDLRPGLLR